MIVKTNTRQWRTNVLNFGMERTRTTKSDNIYIRIDTETKRDAEQLFGSFGIILSDAITVFLRKSLMEGGLPFEMRQPRYNKETEAAMKEARAISEGLIASKSYSSPKELLEDLDKDDE